MVLGELLLVFLSFVFPFYCLALFTHVHLSFAPIEPIAI